MPPIPADAEERRRLIAHRAAELCEARRGSDGPNRADWIQAEREMAIAEAILAAAARDADATEAGAAARH
jgi:hypothetical protein